MSTSILVISDHRNHSLDEATHNLISAAQQLGKDIHILVAGRNCSSAADSAAQIDGVTKVLLADHDAYSHQLAENVSALVAEIGQTYSHILAPASTTGKNLLPRVAALLDVGMISDVISIEAADIFTRPIYAGNAIARVQSADPIKVMTLRPTAFDAAAMKEGSAPIASLDLVKDLAISSFVGEESAKSDRPELTSARVVISGGLGLKSAENFEKLYSIADNLDAAVGASRAAVDSGYVSNDMQVGQTGKIVAPDLYIAIGISGAIQHLAGMKESKVIVAINKDPEAPIFQVADYGLVADLFEALPELEARLSATK